MSPLFNTGKVSQPIVPKLHRHPCHRDYSLSNLWIAECRQIIYLYIVSWVFETRTHNIVVSAWGSLSKEYWSVLSSKSVICYWLFLWARNSSRFYALGGHRNGNMGECWWQTQNSCVTNTEQVQPVQPCHQPWLYTVGCLFYHVYPEIPGTDNRLALIQRKTSPFYKISGQRVQKQLRFLFPRGAKMIKI